MNQQECKKQAIHLLNQSDEVLTVDGKKIVIAAAHVWATLALVPDEKPVDRGDLGPI